MKYLQIFTFLLCISFFANAQNRVLNITGIVIDSETFIPLENVQIRDSNSKTIGLSDSKGFFTTRIEIAETGEIEFGFDAKKSGYNTHIQAERWGDLGSDLHPVYYIALKNHNSSNTSSHSEHHLDFKPNTFESISPKFGDFKKKVIFNNKVAAAKSGNEDVLIEIDKDFFIVNKTGYIQLKSEKDLISINGLDKVAANEINKRLKRQNIKSMSKSHSEVIVYTK